MSNYLAKVSEFHRTFGHPEHAMPLIPSPDRCSLRVDLLQEELDELQAAIEAGDLVGIADALTDLQYVLSGAVLEFGLPFLFDDLFAEVHRSNMSKVWLQSDYESYRLGPGLTFQKYGAYYMAYNESGKVVKPPSYSPADLTKILGPYLKPTK